MESLANLFLALVLGIPVVTYATVAHRQTELCAAMGGTFTPQPGTPPFAQADVCPGGRWTNLVRRKPAQQQEEKR